MGYENITALVVDDDPYARECLLIYLKGKGITVDGVSYADDAIGILDKGDYHLAICDTNLLEIGDGFRVGEHYRRKYPKESNPERRVLVGMCDDPTSKAAWIDIGANGFLGKPFKEGDIDKILEKYFRP